LVATGRRMMEGGYRQLLKPSKRSRQSAV